MDWKPIQDQHKNQRHRSKKVEVQKVIIKSEGDDIKDAFELFDANDGKINTREIRTVSFDEKNPGAYEVMTELDNTRKKNLGGASFNDFCQTVNNRIPERETTEDKNFCQYFLLIKRHQ